MTTQKDGGAAFPIPMPIEALGSIEKDGKLKLVLGLTKREWFAGMVLQGILAGRFADTIPHDDISGGSEAAGFAYMYADAMIAEGEK